jgi:hypothetical protein
VFFLEDGGKAFRVQVAFRWKVCVRVMGGEIDAMDEKGMKVTTKQQAMPCAAGLATCAFVILSRSTISWRCISAISLSCPRTRFSSYCIVCVVLSEGVRQVS